MMKGDLILLGVTGAALLLIPLTVMGASGAQLPQAAPPVSASASQPTVVHTPGASASMGEWQTTEIPGGKPAPSKSDPPPKQSSPSSEPSVAAGVYKTDLNSFKILNRSTGKVEELTVEEYVRGAIAAEMPASFHSEALKAQGVAALTYAVYHHQIQQQNPDPALLGADFSADPDNRKGYMTERKAKQFYGDNWRYNWDKICKAADEAQKYLVLYEGQPIAAAYHAISTGTTEAAENIWDKPMPCLVPVDSSGDILARGYRSTVTLTQDEIKKALSETSVELLPNADTWFSVKGTSPSGYVTEVQVGNQIMSGNELRNLLGLRSSSFQIERQGKDFLFYVQGYGHGAGLSQNGADYLARQGDSFVEILEHYYHGGMVTPVQFG